MFHEKLSVGPENNFQKSMNCQLIILYGLLNSDNNIYTKECITFLMKKECMVLNENKNQNESRNYKLLNKI